VFCALIFRTGKRRKHKSGRIQPLSSGLIEDNERDNHDNVVLTET
jgi:hypothetical protein